MKKFVRWFNETSWISWLLTPLRLKFAWRGYQRVRICEQCHSLTKDIHWSKKDRKIQGKMVYDHAYLCDYCFYNNFYDR